VRRRAFLFKCSPVALATNLLPGLSRGQSVAKSAAASETKPGASGRLIQDLERLLPELLKEQKVPGLSIAVIQQGRLLWNRGFGVKDAESNTPVDDQTVFEAASVSKTVFSYMVMKLCEQNVIGLDVPLVQYTRHRYLEGDARLDQITARHVLSHRCGFQNWRSKEKPLSIQFVPGEGFSYSGEGYSYLQSVITELKGTIDSTSCSTYEADLKVCATNFDAYMKERILAPFNMTSSGYVWSQNMERHAARPHNSEGKPLIKRKPSATDAARYASAGGLHTTAVDYARFLLEIITPKSADEFRLNASTRDEMVRPQVKLKESESIDGATAWALGWAVQERSTGNVILHSGGNEGFRSLTMASLKNKSAFVMLSNGDNGGPLLFNPRLSEILNPLLEGRV
jgi:CubicO group peptidase (beta-lactamase class C family)